MGALTDNTIASTYKQLLKITSEGVGADASAKYVEDGLGTDTALSLSTTRIGIGTASPANILHIVHTGGDSNAGIKIISTASDSFNWITEATNSNLTAGEHLVHMFGKEQATKNSAHIGFTFNSDHGDDNTLNLGFFGANDILNVTSGGKVGIGTTSPARILELNGASNTDGIRFNNKDYSYYNEICNNGDGLIFRVDPGTAGGSGVDFRWTINDDEKMRLVQSGRLGINATSPNARLHINEGTNGQELVYLDHTASGEQTMILFKTEGTTRGTIKSDNSPSQTAYNTSSDKRLKENIVEVDDALSIVNKIPVKQFNFIEDENNTPIIGYIGQELMKEYPQAVSVAKTEQFDDHHMVDQSKMVAVLMKAVQELSAKVEALENA